MTKKLLTSSLLVASFIFSPGLSLPAHASPAMNATFAPVSQANSNQSYNWAGYVASSGSYTSVSGAWNVPTATSYSTSTMLMGDATWIGIGGITGTDLIQVGTEAIVNGAAVNDSSSGSVSNDIASSPGQVLYEPWFELLPAGSVTIPVVIHPGDSVSAAITETAPDQWSITFRDITTGQAYSTIQSYTSSHSSAEWIEEMPSDSLDNGSVSLIPLDNFGSVQFSNAATTMNANPETIAQAGGSILYLLNGNQQAMAVPSALGLDGQSFTVSRTTALPTSNNTARITRFERRGYGQRGATQQTQAAANVLPLLPDAFLNSLPPQIREMLREQLSQF